jgi:hypothetical protein
LDSLADTAVGRVWILIASNWAVGADVDVAVSDAEFDRLLLLPRPPKIFSIFY